MSIFALGEYLHTRQPAAVVLLFFCLRVRFESIRAYARRRSHTLLGDRQACLPDGEREYLRPRRIPPPLTPPAVVLLFFFLLILTVIASLKALRADRLISASPRFLSSSLQIGICQLFSSSNKVSKRFASSYVILYQEPFSVRINILPK